MKNIAILLAFMFVSAMAFSQDRNEFKGPAYKNYKPWQNKKSTKHVYTSNRKAGLTGPTYKNYKPWKDTSEIKYVVVQSKNERSKLTGPAYKNYKAWKNK
jgi:hypothetical protein